MAEIVEPVWRLEAVERESPVGPDPIGQHGSQSLIRFGHVQTQPGRREHERSDEPMELFQNNLLRSDGDPHRLPGREIRREARDQLLARLRFTG